MKLTTYIEKYGCVYGVASRFSFGEWVHKVYVFKTAKDAVDWLQSAKFEYRERELCSKRKAEQYAGKFAVAHAIEL